MREINKIVYDELIGCHETEMTEPIDEGQCQVTLELDDEVAYKLLLAAEYFSETFNEYVNGILKEYLEDVL